MQLLLIWIIQSLLSRFTLFILNLHALVYWNLFNFFEWESFINSSKFFSKRKHLFITHCIRIDVFFFRFFNGFLNHQLFFERMLILMTHHLPKEFFFSSSMSVSCSLLFFLKLKSKLKRNCIFRSHSLQHICWSRVVFLLFFILR